MEVIEAVALVAPVVAPAAPGPPVAPGSPVPPVPPVALYIHVPFCVSLCPYCDFVVLSGAATRGPRNRLEPFVQALLMELELRADELLARFGPPGSASRPPLGSVYLGGGTPSLLSAAWVGTLLDRVADRFGIAAGAEITLEANPGPTEIGDLAGFRAAGVDRLSLGAQSFDAHELQSLGRRHRPSDVEQAVRAARTAGFARLSVDLLYDVPGQTATTWATTLRGVLDLGLDHVSAYALTLDDPDAEGLTGVMGDHLPVRSGARRWRERARPLQDPDRAADQYLAADAAFEAAGLRWYELSNWAAPGQESRHNLVYWRGQAYEAVGPGAHAYDGAATRRWNAARIDSYVGALLPAIGRGRLPPGGSEQLDPATVVAERAMLALRTRDGASHELAQHPAVAPALAWARTAGLVESAVADPQAAAPATGGVERSGMRLTARGRLLSNELFLRLLPERTAAA